MLHLILGWALIALGLIDLFFAVRAWFDGSVYLPVANLAAVIFGIVVAIVGVVILIW